MKYQSHTQCPGFVQKHPTEELWVHSWKTPEMVAQALSRYTPIQIARGTSWCGNSSLNASKTEIVDTLRSSQLDQLSWTARISQHVKSGQGKLALKMYKEMREAGINLSSHTFVAVLKACSSLRDLKSAKRIHDDVVETGFEADVNVGTMLVEVYTKCGSLLDARCVFDSMPHRDVVSWNAMILGYAQLENGAEALQLYTRMSQEGVTPNQRTLFGALKACSSLAAVEQASKCGVKKRCMEQIRTIHSDAVKGGLLSDICVGNMLVDLYGKSGSLVDAKYVFAEMLYRDVVSWNSMISAYVHMGHGEEALQLYQQMPSEGVVRDSRTFVGALKACSGLLEGNKSGGVLATKQCLEQVRAIHAEVQKSGCETAEFVGTMLLDVYAKCGNLVDARLIFERMPHRDVVPWNALIMGYAQMEEGAEALQLYTQMRQEGVIPNSRTFVAALKACSSLTPRRQGGRIDSKRQCLEQVKAIHSDVVKAGQESDLFVGNMLMDVYIKSLSLVDARHVFEKMLYHDVVSWNVMILGYAQMGEGAKALNLYTQMRKEGVAPNHRTFVGALKGCSALSVVGEGSKERVLEQVKAIHSEIVKGQSDSDLFVGNMLVDVYAKNGSLVDAWHVFEKMPCQDVVSWNSMILGYALMEDGERAWQLYTQMQEEGVVPDDRTFVAALKACSSMVALEQGNGCNGPVVSKRCMDKVRAIHSQIVKGGSESALFVGTMLVDVYAKCGSLVDARRVFEKLAHRDVVSWNSIILGHASMGQGDEALKLYTVMQAEGVVPDDRTYVCVLKACSTLVTMEKCNDSEGMLMKKHCLDQVRAIHSRLVNRGCELTVFVATMLVDVYGKCESLADARHVFENMSHRDAVPWTSMILGYAQSGQGEEALQLFTRMQEEGVVPDDRTFVAALKACSSVAALEEGNHCDGILVKKRTLKRVKAIHSAVVESGSESDVYVGTMLIDVYVKCGCLVDARGTFDKMPHRHAATWNVMILGYAQMEGGDTSLELYARMQQEGVVPNNWTFVAALKACGAVSALDKGRQIHAQISETGLEASDSYVASSLIDMYATCGSMASAQQVFDALLTTDVVPWNALIAGYAHQGDSELVFYFFQRMRQEGTQPNSVTFLSILSVCGHVGLVDKGQEYFEAMITEYAINPTIEHYNCMLDLFGRAGQLDHAMAIATSSTVQPNLVTWKTVLAACQKWNNVELAKQAFQRAMALDKDDAAAYVLMSNIYTASRMLQNAKEIQAVRVNTRSWKKPGQSWWTDMVGTVHVFMAGEEDHSQVQYINAQLKDVSVRLGEEGYAPQLASILPEVSEDEGISFGRSSKPADAYVVTRSRLEEASSDCALHRHKRELVRPLIKLLQ